ncbi:MAG: NAD(P)H-dependent oxidoreductase [Blautia sp.]|nr:NAD(P)H-dependent oxidoreductase [Blautia sp.]
MKITVLNGSPKGKNSITLQTVNYLSLLYPEHEFDIFHVGQMIGVYEKDPAMVFDSLKSADLILFSYPVYTFIAPSQLHRFIHLMKNSDLDLTGKYATQFTTSKHFYDITAHNYIQENCQDMGIKFIKGLSADMDDLTVKSGQKDAEEFLKYVSWCVKNDVYDTTPVSFDARSDHDYKSSIADVPAHRSHSDKRDVVIVTDCTEENVSLTSMIQRFQAVLPVCSRIVNIREFPFRGGCIGCFNCAATGKCIYKDEFDEFLRSNIQTGDAIVYACSIEDHSMGWLFKQYDDRQFCNGHRTVTMGKPFGYLIDGDYSREFNLRTIVEGRAEVGGNFLAGVASNEKDVNAQIDALAARLTYALKHHYVQPSNFYGVGGMKIFRDLIYLMQGLMRADHKFYKEHGQYDFPQKKKGTLVGMYVVGAMMNSPKIKKKIGGKMTEGMLMPYQKVLNDVKKKQ